jgi:hypothetical protein
MDCTGSRERVISGWITEFIFAIDYDYMSMVLGCVFKKRFIRDRA